VSGAANPSAAALAVSARLDDAQQKSEGVWHAAWRRFKSDRVGFGSMWIVLFFFVLIALAGTGLIAKNWQTEVGVPNAPPTLLGPRAAQTSGAVESPTGPNVDLSAVDPLAPRYQEWDEKAKQYQTTETVKSETLPFGGDRLGRDVLEKAIKGTEISVFVGVAAALCATLIGTLMGAFAGFFGGKVNDLLEWVYNVFESIPNILLIFAFAAVVGRGVGSVVIILALTGWTGMYRQVRAEFIKHRSREYVRSAEAIGASNWSRMFKHILPNVSHVVLVRMGLLVVGFIKAEVILSYLGLGVRVDQVSWGTMLAEAQAELILGHWWQLATATLFMAVFVTAFSLMADALRDALDPKLRGLE
jgi:peptide/nickel transport system permease protein